MRVTVIETIDHSADITPEMVEAYLVRNGWTLDYECGVGRWYENSDRCVWVPLVGKWCNALAADAMTVIGSVENRKPHEVLADIARGM